MAAIDDLKSAVADLSASISAEVQAITDKLSAKVSPSDGSVSSADAETIVGELQALKSTVDKETQTLTSISTPAPTTPGGTPAT